MLAPKQPQTLINTVCYKHCW